MAGAVAAAMQVALDRWLRSEPPVALVPLLRQALGELRWPSAADRHADSEFACQPATRPPRLAGAARQPPTPTPNPGEGPC
jgi:hypothetical protein